MKRVSRPSPLVFFLAFLALGGLLTATVIALRVPDTIMIILIVPLALAALMYPRRVYLWLVPVVVVGIIWDNSVANYASLEVFTDAAIALVLTLGIGEVLYRLSGDRIRREQSLSETEALFRNLFDSSPLGLGLADDRGNFLYFNDEMLAPGGYTRDDILQMKNVAHLYYDPIQRATVLADAAREGFVNRRHVQFKRKDGTPYDTLLSLRRINYHGQTCWQAMVEDLTERRQANEKIQLLLAAEQAARSRAEALHAASAALTSSLDLDTVLNVLLDTLQTLVPYDSANVMRLGSDGRMRLTNLRGYEKSTDLEAVRAVVIDPAVEPPLQELFTLRSVLIPDVTQHEGWVRHPETSYVNSWMGIPLVSDGQLFGLFSIDKSERGFFTKEHLELAEALAVQAVVAIKNARLIDAIRRRNQYLTALRRVTSRAVPERNRDNFLQAVAEALAREFEYPIVSIFLGDEDSPHLTRVALAGKSATRPPTGPDDLRQPYDRGATGWAMLHAEPQLIRYFQPESAVNGGKSEPDVGCELAVPINLHGRTLGVLYVSSQDPDGLDTLDQEALVELSAELALNLENLILFEAQVGVADENGRLFRDSEERLTRLSILQDITRIAAHEPDLTTMLQRVSETLAGFIGSEETRISLWDEQHQLTIPISNTGKRRGKRQFPNFRPGDRTLTLSALEAGKPLVIEDVHNTPYVSAEIAKQSGNQSALVAPLRAEGRKLGGLVISFKHPRQFTDDEIDWALQAAELIALAIAKAQAYAVLEDRVAERTARLRAANERLTQLSRLKDEFVQNVSHELRTPITSIKLYHRLLETRTDKHSEYLTRLDRETKRLENIIEELLALSRLDQNRVVLDEHPVDMNTLAQEHVEDRELLAEERGLELEFNRSLEIPLVHGDQALLGQALSVILTNAINYTPRGGRVIVATDALRKNRREWVRLSVRDNGPGISAEDAPRLFQRFFRGQTGVNSWVPGTGLGLALAHEIVERHGGHITVDNAGVGGEGANFVIWLRAID